MLLDLYQVKREIGSLTDHSLTDNPNINIGNIQIELTTDVPAEGDQDQEDQTGGARRSMS